MADLLTAEQMRRVEGAAIAAGDVTGLQLMERAGEGVVQAVFAQWPDLAEGAHHAIVLCGPGNNGGDGYVIARLLKARGWRVEAFAFGDPTELPADARANYQRWRVLGRVARLEEALLSLTDAQPLVVDALFGTGLSRAVPDLVRDVLTAARGQRRVAVDLPSILSSDTGRAVVSWPEDQPAADLTVSFHRLKLGHVLAEGPALCGRVVTADIGLRQQEQHKDVVHAFTAPVAARLAKIRGHKFNHGHAVILSGGAGRTGAARLAARGALRIGAGLVTLGGPRVAEAELSAQVTAIMVRQIDVPSELEDVLTAMRATALCVGPGFGLDRAKLFVPAALASKTTSLCAIVLDADALSAFADAPDTLLSLLHPGCVLTPHGGEFARLFPDLAKRLHDDPATSKVDVTRAAAARAGCVVLFKGEDTVIAAPDGTCRVHSASYDRAAPWLATAGAGDVLAGFITGLLARGYSPFEAASIASWLHVTCARRFGPGLIAEDLPEVLPAVLRDLEKDLREP